MHRVRVFEAVPLVDGAAGEVEEVAGLQHNVQAGGTDLSHAEVATGNPGKKVNIKIQYLQRNYYKIRTHYIKTKK